jgi:hypothetical protein
VCKEDGIYAADALVGGKCDKVVDYSTFEDPNNGRAMAFQTPYVYFNLGRGGLERLVERNMDDIGIWRGEGWAENERGPISCIIAHPRQLFVSIDAGDYGFSTIYAVNNGQWYCIYRCPREGKRIINMIYETIPGKEADRLWFGEGDDIRFLTMPSGLNPLQDSYYMPSYEYSITSSWIDDGTRDLPKYFKSLKVFSEGLAASTKYIELEYQVDDDAGLSDWTVLSGTTSTKTADVAFDVSPSEELDLDVKGKRFRYTLRGYSASQYSTPNTLVAATLSMVTIVPPKYKIEVTFGVDEEDGTGIDLQGDDDGQAVATMLNQLDTWASDSDPVLLSCVDAQIDQIYVFVQPAPHRLVNLIAGETKSYACKITLLQK